MKRNRLLLAAAAGSMFFLLSACPLPGTNEEVDADFYAASSGLRGQNGYVFTGHGWKPGSKLEIQMFQEPGDNNGGWKRLAEATPDNIGMFGYTGNPPFYPVRRSLCGTPENGQQAAIMVKNTSTGRFKIRQFPVDIYFTFQRCP